jgi:thymidine phosphorylase
MATPQQAQALALSLVGVANGAGCRTSALLTDMNEPLASCAGNAIEVANACAFLTGREIDPRLWDVTVALGGELLALSGLARDAAEGGRAIAAAFESGRAAERFARMVSALGGPADFMERFAEILPAAPVIRDIAPTRDGVAQRIDARAIGLAVIELGGGRMRSTDGIDHAVGFDRLAGLGAHVSPDAPLGRVHARTVEAADRAAAALRAAFTVGEAAPDAPDPVLRRIGPGEVA